MSIFEVRHQPRAQRLIQRALASDRLPHAYIFHGPEGVGREMFAQRLGKLLLCERRALVSAGDVEGFERWSGGQVVDACQECEACRAVHAGTHPDQHIVYRELIKQHPDPVVRARKGIDLGIDVIREFVISRVGNKPAMGRGKVFIVREADKMNVAAQNALLKTLEEPPATTFLMLVTASLDRLLPTVRSRCQQIPFGPLPADFIVEHLVANNDAITTEEAGLCAAYGSGSLGLAQRHHDDRLMEYDARMGEVFTGLRQGGVSQLAKRIIANAKELGGVYQTRDQAISDTEAQRQGLKSLLSLLSDRYRHALHAAVGVADGQVHTTADDQPDGPGQSLTAGRAADAIRTITTTERQLDLNANVQLCVEGLLIHLSRLIQPEKVSG